MCPYAYIASHKIARLAAALRGAHSIEWRPVVLGGLYEANKAPQGKGGSASDVWPAAKQALARDDLKREASRNAVPLTWNAKHPAKSVDALRLIVSVDADRREAVSRSLFKAVRRCAGTVCCDARSQRLLLLLLLHRGLLPLMRLWVMLACGVAVLGGRCRHLRPIVA